MAEDSPVRIAFVCVENSCRSQIAEGIARALGGERVAAPGDYCPIVAARPFDTVKPNEFAGGSRHSAWQNSDTPVALATGVQVHCAVPAAPGVIVTIRSADW